MRKLLSFIFILIFFICCTDSDRKAHMESLLMDAKAQNEAGEPFSTDSLMKEVAAYYNEYGSANTNMLADYLLGCTYRDLGDWQLALHYYHKAVEHADTASADCDFKTLSRIYGQMALLFLNNESPQNAICLLDDVIRYGYLANDTLIVLQAYEQKASAYYYMGDNDSVVVIREKVSGQYAKHGYHEYAALALGPVIQVLIDNEEYGKAKRYMDIYESESGIFNSYGGDIESGREIYYMFKGEYFLGINQLDSAEHYFRKCLSNSICRESKSAAFVGLYSLYTELKVSDSIAKYAVLCNITNDSIYSDMVADKLQQEKSVYNYNKNENDSYEKQKEVEFWKNLTIMSCSFILIVLVFGYWKYRSYTKLKNVDVLENEVLANEKSDIEKVLYSSDVYTKFKYLADNNIRPLQEDWTELRKFIDRVIPDFYVVLNSQDNKLRMDEYDICILVRLHFAPYELCRLTDKSSSYVSMIRQRMLKKVFGVEGKPKDFDNFVCNIF